MMQGPEKSMTIFEVRKRSLPRSEVSECVCEYVYVPVDSVSCSLEPPSKPFSPHFTATFCQGRPSCRALCATQPSGKSSVLSQDAVISNIPKRRTTIYGDNSS